MKREIITISENGSVSVPDKVMMQDFEIAWLFGVTIPAVRANIRTILKTGIATGDYTNGATLVGNNILPDCYIGYDYGSGFSDSFTTSRDFPQVDTRKSN